MQTWDCQLSRFGSESGASDIWTLVSQVALRCIWAGLEFHELFPWIFIDLVTEKSYLKDNSPTVSHQILSYSQMLSYLLYCNLLIDCLNWCLPQFSTSCSMFWKFQVAYFNLYAMICVYLVGSIRKWMINHILPSNLEVLMNMPGNTVMSTEEKKKPIHWKPYYCFQ